MTTPPDGTPSRDEVVAAVSAWVWVPATAARVETAESLVVRYPDWYEHPVQLLRVTPQRPVGEVLDEVLAGCAGAGVDRVLAWVALDAPAGLEEALRARGGVLEETLDVLARGIGPDRLPALDPPGDVDVAWVEDLTGLRSAVELGVEVFGGTSPDDDALERELPGEVGKLRTGGGGTVLARLDGRAVGSGGVTVVDGVARLWSGGVLPAARGRGVYRALLDARLRYAVRHGARLALVKGRVETSAPTLRRAGFDAVGQQRSYLVRL